MSAHPLAGRRARAGFSFIEILVVMAIIAVLVGIGVGVYTLVVRETPKMKCKNLVMKMRANVDLYKGRYKFNPPSEFARMSDVLGPQMKLGRPTPSNTSNAGIESLYQAMLTPGFGHAPELAEGERANTDDDRLDKAFDPNGDVELWEVVDPWGNPLVYFTDGDYASAEKQQPTYVKGDGTQFTPKPWRTQEGGGFAQPNGFQLFSIGPDGEPNTEDDIKSWE